MLTCQHVMLVYSEIVPPACQMDTAYTSYDRLHLVKKILTETEPNVIRKETNHNFCSQY